MYLERFARALLSAPCNELERGRRFFVYGRLYF